MTLNVWVGLASCYLLAVMGYAFSRWVDNGEVYKAEFHGLGLIWPLVLLRRVVIGICVTVIKLLGGKLDD